MPDASLSQALQEAYASAPNDVIIFHTLEVRHPDFKDEAGQSVAIRVVRDQVDLFARLEDLAPLDAGQQVRFVAMGFELDLPPVDIAPVPEISISLDNVTREIVEHLDAASISEYPIEITYRPYLSCDLEGPQMDPPITLVITEVEADVQRVVAKARMVDIGSKTFPSRLYTAIDFPGLAR